MRDFGHTFDLNLHLYLGKRSLSRQVDHLDGNGLQSHSDHICASDGEDRDIQFLSFDFRGEDIGHLLLATSVPIDAVQLISVIVQSAMAEQINSERAMQAVRSSFQLLVRLAFSGKQLNDQRAGVRHCAHAICLLL